MQDAKLMQKNEIAELIQHMINIQNIQAEIKDAREELNVSPESERVKELRKKLREANAELSISFDGIRDKLKNKKQITSVLTLDNFTDLVDQD